MTYEEKMRSICQDRCAEFGEPACWTLDIPDRPTKGWCDDCRIEAGERVDEPLDPNAVLRPLL